MKIKYNKKCIICGKTFFVPYRHHIDGNKKNNDKKNLIIVCQNCHYFIHHPKKSNIVNWENFICNNLNYAFKQKDMNIYYNLNKKGKKVYI